MRRLVITFTAAVLLAAASRASAGGVSAYPTSASQVSNQVYQPNNLLGAPDGQYATFQADQASVVLNFGQDVTGNLTVTYQLLQFGAKYRVDFLDGNGNTLAYGGGTFNIGTTDVVPFSAAPTYRAVRLTDTDSQTFNIDAVAATAATAETPVSSTPAPALAPSSGAAPSPSLPPQGSLIKGTETAAVYEVGVDGKRHAFPSSSVYFSWYQDFSAVQTVSADVLASFPLGKNVTMRPGTNLIKIVSSPDVYAVYPGGVIRWIPDETVAQILFGYDWNKKVVDVADVFFTNYRMGGTLTSSDVAPSPDAAQVPF